MAIGLWMKRGREAYFGVGAVEVGSPESGSELEVVVRQYLTRCAVSTMVRMVEADVEVLRSKESWGCTCHNLGRTSGRPTSLVLHKIHGCPCSPGLWRRFERLGGQPQTGRGSRAVSRTARGSTLRGRGRLWGCDWPRTRPWGRGRAVRRGRMLLGRRAHVLVPDQKVQQGDVLAGAQEL